MVTPTATGFETKLTKLAFDNTDEICLLESFILDQPNDGYGRSEKMD